MFQKAPYTCTCTETSQAELTLCKDRVGSTHVSHTTREEELLSCVHVPGEVVLSGLCVMDQSAVTVLQAKVMNFNQLYWLP